MEKDRLRILFLQAQTDWAGSPPSVVQHLLASNLDREAFDAHVACAVWPHGGPTEPYLRYQEILGIRLRPTNFGSRIFQTTKRDAVKGLVSTGLAFPATLGGLVRYARRHRIDIVHGSEDPRDALAGSLIARMTDAKHVFHLHAKTGSWMRPSVFRAMRRADAVVGISQFVADSAVSIGCKPERTDWAHNAIDVARWDHRIDGRIVRDEFSISPDTIVFATVAKIRPWKGQELTVRALARIKDRLPEFRYLVVGSGSVGDDTAYSTSLRRLADELGIGAEVVLTGVRTDVASLLAACDFSVMPFFEEGFGLAVIEAMAMGKAVLALDNGGPRELVEHGRSGLLSQPDDVDGLARNIHALATDERLRAELGAYGRRRAEEYFNPQRLAGDFERIYRDVRGARVARRRATASSTPRTNASVH